MFWHNLKYNLMFLFKNKNLIFWTFAFPIIMATLFNLAFSDIEKNEQLNKFNIAIVDNTEYQNDEVLKTTFQKLEKDIFDITGLGLVLSGFGTDEFS